MFHVEQMKVKDHSISKEWFELIYDENYDMYKTQPIPENLDLYYQSDNYISHTDRKKGIIEKLYQRVKTYNIKNKIKLINNHQTQKGKLLDIGSGTGYFLLEAKKNKWEVYGIEPNEKARLLSEKKGLKLCSNQNRLPPTLFNCITLWHVLEHIPDLKNQLNFLKSKLTNDGTLIIAVPNYKSWDAKHYKEYWAAYDVPRHLWHFSKNSIEKLFKEIDMEIVTTKPMWFDSFYVSILSEKYKYGKINYLRAFINGIRSNGYGILKKEFSSHIYILKN